MIKNYNFTVDACSIFSIDKPFIFHVNSNLIAVNRWYIKMEQIEKIFAKNASSLSIFLLVFGQDFA